MKRRGYHSKRRGVAGIVAAVILFAMLFTVGTSYFIFVNNANLLYNKALVSRTNQIGESLLENLILNPSLASNGHIQFYANNTGGVNVNITAIFVLDPSGNVLKCDGRGLPSVACGNSTPALPLVLNLGKGTSNMDTGYTYVTGTDTIKVITERGSTFTQTYPVTPVPFATLAVSTQGVGVLQINFNTYVYYYTSANCNPTNVGCQLLNFPTGSPAYSMPSFVTGGSQFYVYAVTVQNVDPQKRTITLDSNCILNQYQVPLGGGSNAKNFAWRVGSVSSSGVTQVFTSIVIAYNQVVTLYFTIIPGTTTANWPSAGNYVADFMFLHGSLATNSYGQNVPFVTTLYN